MSGQTDELSGLSAHWFLTTDNRQQTTDNRQSTTDNAFNRITKIILHSSFFILHFFVTLWAKNVF